MSILKYKGKIGWGDILFTVCITPGVIWMVIFGTIRKICSGETSKFTFNIEV
uniref:Uncharacterized protein n=1 Tax=viral metagenome TaxID=1070528 RepID=A0A6M3KCY3_9ZZZZ